jgi:protein-S-isoprenylcysteine O-methyltransferase Ste14
MGPGPTLLVGPLIFAGVMAVIATVMPPMNESPLAIVLAGLGAMILGVGAWLLIWRQLTT